MSKDNYNTLAVLAIIFAFIFPLAGLVLGIIALNQIKKTGEKGRGLAIAAIILPIVAVILVGIIWAVVGGIVSTAVGNVPIPGA